MNNTETLLAMVVVELGEQRAELSELRAGVRDLAAAIETFCRENRQLVESIRELTKQDDGEAWKRGD